MTITLIILSVLLAISSGIFNAVTDLSSEGKLKGNKYYWNKNYSWQNKWQNGNKSEGERFKFSSTILVFITDAWHLFNLLFRLSFASLYTLLGFLISISLWYLFGCLIAYIIFATSFHIFHTYKILRK